MFGRKACMDDDEFMGKFPVIAPGSFEQPVSGAILVGAIAKSLLVGLAVGLVCLGVGLVVHSTLVTVLIFGRAVMIGAVLSFGVFLAQARQG